jgi:hypothetical protein
MLVLSDIVIFFSSVVEFTPSGQFLDCFMFAFSERYVQIKLHITAKLLVSGQIWSCNIKGRREVVLVYSLNAAIPRLIVQG